MRLGLLLLLVVSCRLNYEYLGEPGLSAGASSSMSIGASSSDGGATEPAGGARALAGSGMDAGAATLGGAAGPTGDAGATGGSGAPSCTEIDCGPTGLGAGTLVTFGYDDADFNGAVSDTFVTSNAPTDDYENYGFLAVNSIPDTTVTLLRFDLSGLPVGATITGAELRLGVKTDPSTMGSVTIHQVLEPRTEWQTTWHERATGVPWTAPGCGVGSRSELVLARFEPYAVQAYQIPLPVNVIQGWVNDPNSNFGFALAGDGSDYVDFKPANVGSGIRPQLSLTYQ